MTKEIEDQLAQKIQDLLNQLADPSVSIAVTDSASRTLRFHVDQQMTWQPQLSDISGIKEKVLRKGQTHGSQDAAIEMATKRAQDTALAAVQGGDLPQQPAPDTQDAATTLWTAPQADTYMIVCDSCAGNGRFTCKTCGGRGQSNCANCGGTGNQVCMMCGGTTTEQRSQMINGQYVTDYVMCANCVGSGQQSCNSCFGGGTSSCGTCGGRGHQQCNDCNGKGELIAGFMGRVDLEVSSDLTPPADLPSVAEEFATSRADLVANASNVEKTGDQTGELTREISWDIEVPVVELGYQIGDHAFHSSGAGTNLLHVEHAPFLDTLYRDRVQAAYLIAQSSSVDRSKLDEALKDLVSFGLGRSAIERAARGQTKTDQGMGIVTGAASSNLVSTVEKSARGLLQKLSDDAAGPKFTYAAGGAGLLLLVTSLTGGWEMLDGFLSSWGMGAFLLALVVSVILAIALTVFCFFNASRRITELTGVKSMRLNVSWRTWATIGGVLAAGPVSYLLLNLL